MVQVIFETDQFINNLYENNFKNQFNNSNEFKGLCYLKKVKEELLMEAWKLSPNMLDSRGNRESGWGVSEKRGGKDYYPSLGWKGYGIKCISKVW